MILLLTVLLYLLQLSLSQRALPPVICKNDFLFQEGRIECDNRPRTCTGCNLRCIDCYSMSCNTVEACINSNITVDGVSSGAYINCGGNHACVNTSIKGFSISDVWLTDGSASGSQIYVEGTSQGVTLSCGGDYGCYNVNVTLKNAKIIYCNGDNSCQQSTINAKCIKGAGCPLKCDGDFSCWNNSVTISNLKTFDCNGDNSCSFSDVKIDCVKTGCFFIFNGDQSFRSSKLIATNVSGFNCGGDDTCTGAKLNLTCLSKTGCPIECLGDYSCNGTLVNAKNVRGLSCGGENACRDYSKFYLECNQGCSIQCGGVYACTSSLIKAYPLVSYVACTGSNSCYDTKLDLVCDEEKGCDVECLGVKGCRKSEFRIINAKALKCGSAHACEGANWNIVESKYGGSLSCAFYGCAYSHINVTGLSNLFCKGFYSCSHAAINAYLLDRSVFGKFLLVFNNYGAQNAVINVVVLEQLHSEIVILCEGLSGCENMVLSIYSETTVYVSLIKCGQFYSCKNATINFYGSVELSDPSSIIPGKKINYENFKIYDNNVQVFPNNE